MAPAPRASLAPRRATQAEHIYELGVVGRKTGVTVPDSGVRDEHGMEPLDNLFSSPGKSERGGQEDEMVSDDEDDGSGEQAMDITTTSGIGPAALLNGHGSRLPMPMARVKSPVKTLLKSPAQRNRLLARNSSSPARGAVVRDNAEKATSSSQPARRLDFRSVESGGPHSLSQPTRGRLANGHHRLQPFQREDSDEGSERGAEDDGVDEFVEESMAMLSGGDDHDLPAQLEPQAPASDDAEAEEEEEQTAPTPPAQKQKGRPPKQKETAPAKAAKPAKKPARAPVEEEEDDAEEPPEEEDEPPAKEDEEEEEAAAVPRRRQVPHKSAKPAAAGQPPARGVKKRRRLDEEEETAAAAEQLSPEPQPKRQRAEPAASKTAKPAPEPKQPAASSKNKTNAADQAASAGKGQQKGRKRKSSITDPGDVSQVTVARRPPLPKSRGLLINRREVPGASSSMFRTRSGRNSFKPLAYWRNERVDYEKDEAEDAYSGRTHRSKFVLPSLKEVVRVDEPEPEPRPKSSSRKGGRQKGRRKSRGYASDDEDDGPADLWELDPGTVTGEVVVWQPEYEFAPPAPNDLVGVMDKQLAISGHAIKTTAVVGGEFRYAKVFSEGFIGAGVVDLPPGAVKRLKNSRKVFMIFFVHAGRVLVTVQETSFRISKGGIFIVPRYNEYTIENDYDHPARIFFAQGQETTAKPQAEEQEAAAADNEHAGDEEVEVSEGEEEEEGSGEEEE